MSNDYKFLLEEPKKYIKSLKSDQKYELKEYPPPGSKSGRGKKFILKIIKKEDKDIIIYSYEDYN